MNKEKFINFLKEGIDMLNQGEDMNKVKDFLENVVEKFKKFEYSDELKENLGYYKKLNEKFKNDIDIEFNDENYKKDIKEYQKNLLLDIIDNSLKKDENKDFYCDLGKGDYTKDFDEDFYIRFLEDEYYGVNFIEKIRENSKGKTEYSVLKRYGFEDEMPHFQIKTGDEICYDSKTNIFSMEQFKEDNIDVENFKNIELANNYLKKKFPDKYNVLVATDKLDLSNVNEYIDFNELNKENPIIKYSLKNQEICDEIYSETETYAKVVKEKLSSVMDKNNIIKREDLKELCEDFDIDFNKIEKKFEYSDVLNEKLNHYEKLNEKVKDKIDLKEFEKEIDDFKKIVLKTETEFVRVGIDKFKNLYDISEEEDEFIVDFKNATFKSFEEKSPYLLYERYGLEDKLPDFKVTVDGFDFFDSKNNNEKLEEKLKEEKNINIKDIVEFSKHIKETFKNNDVEVLFEKENGEYAKYNYGDYVENVYDELLDNISEEAKVYRQVIKEEIDNITDKDGIIEEKDLKTLFNKYGTYSKDLFENDKKEKLNENSVDDFNKEKREYLEKEKHYNKLEENTNIDYDLDYFNFLKKEYQGIVLKRVLSNELEKAGDNKYKFKDNFLDDKEKWNGINENKKYDIPNSFYIFDDSMKRMEMLERYDLTKNLPPFQIYTENGDLLFVRDGKINDYNKIENFVKNISGKEYWDNMDLDSYGSWEQFSLREQVEIYVEKENGEKQRVFDEYDYTDCLYQELCKNIKEETDFFNEKVRIDLKENLSDGVIEKEDILKIAKEYDNIKKIEEILDRIDGKESTKLKEIEKQKVNEREID